MYVVGGLVLLEVQLKAVSVANEGVAQLLQLVLLQVLGLDLPIPDLVKSQFLRVSGTDQAAGHRRGEVNTPYAVAHVALALALALHVTLMATSGLCP
jgi:hypothetical protein